MDRKMKEICNKLKNKFLKNLKKIYFIEGKQLKVKRK